MGFWSRVKHAVKSAVRQITTVSLAFVHNIIPNGLDLLFGFLKWPKKKMRLRINILTDPATGKPIIQSSNPNLIDSIDYAIKTFKDECNVEINNNGIYIQPNSPPYNALHPWCDGLYGQDFGESGSFFADHGSYGPGPVKIDPTSPIDVYVVINVVGKTGCSLGPLTNWIVISPEGINNISTLAHEIGHCCSLWHRSYLRSNLMFPNASRSNNIKWWQCNLVRSCRHVNYY
jgi:hypothetical protein